MAIIVGKVECLNIGDDNAFVRIRESATDTETLILWFNPQNPSAFTRVMHSMWTSLLRDAMSDGREVRVTTGSGSNSAFITTVQANSTT